MLLVIHEAGHWLAARSQGVGVERLEIGIGPAIAGANLLQTRCVLRLLPFGGSVRLLDGAEGGAGSLGSYETRTILQKAFIALAGPAANVVAAASLLAVSAGTGAVWEGVMALVGLLAAWISRLITGAGLLESVPWLLTEAGVWQGGATSYPTLLALMSLYIAAFNLLPLLPLDGGRLSLIIAEGILGHRLSPAAAGRLTFAGAAVLIVFCLFVVYEDLVWIVGNLAA